MTINGGIDSSDNDIELSISIGGGKSYKRIYNNVVNVAITKFELISSTLGKLLITNATNRDSKFYIEQVKILLQRAHVEMIEGDYPFQDKYNIWLLDGYVRMLLESNDLKRIAQLLDLDSILYSIEEASQSQDKPLEIEFSVSDKIKVKTVKEIDKKANIALPVADELSAYLHSLDHNLALLTQFISANKPALLEIHKSIIAIASKYLS